VLWQQWIFVLIMDGRIRKLRLGWEICWFRMGRSGKSHWHCFIVDL
jgi:hypothetical protein